MSTLFGLNDVRPEALESARIAVLGYGSQGRAQALNLRDSGLDVHLGLRPGGSSWKEAETDNWAPVSVETAVVDADVVVVLVPDMAQPSVFESVVAPNLKAGALLLFAHGFNVHYGLLTPGTEVDVALVAPKAPGQRVRHEYLYGRGVPALLAVHQDATGRAQERALAYAHGIGSTRAGVLETSFSEETETDLFGEQAVLCGGVTELVVAGFETLVDAGYNPEVAYFECLHELKLIVDLLHEGGLARMHRFVSDTASFGDVTRGPQIVDSHVRSRLKDVLTEIQSGAFAREWCGEHSDGAHQFKDLVKADLAHPIETVGQRLRERMPWLKEAS